MSLALQHPNATLDGLHFARDVLRAESMALAGVADRLDAGFEAVANHFATCRGRIAVTGVGKSADIGAKIAGTLSSTGTRAYTLDSTKARHGDLGMVHPDDVALVLSHSGESEEIVRLLGPLRECAFAITAMTGNGGSTLARMADAAIVYGPLTEACPLALAPSTSTTVMMALGDALAFTLSKAREFTSHDFARLHPAGSLGRKLAPVESYMRRGLALRLAPAENTVREVFATRNRRGRRTGAVMLLDPDGRLAGIFTDSDLARLFERRDDLALDRPIREIMNTSPLTATVGVRLVEAVELMRQRKISELPVLDNNGRPIGLLDITDLLDLIPVDERSAIASLEDEDAPLPLRASA